MFPGYTNSKFPGYGPGGGGGSAKTPTQSIDISSGTNIQPEVDSLVNISGLTDTLNITLDVPQDEYMHDIIFFITTGADPNITITSDSPIKYAESYEIQAMSTYEINCLWNGNAWIIASMAIAD